VSCLNQVMRGALLVDVLLIGPIIGFVINFAVLQVLNQIVFELPPEHPLSDSRPLKEFLGHTPPQVWLAWM